MLLAKKNNSIASLLRGLEYLVLSEHSRGSVEAQEIAFVTADSREASADSLFVALPGVGHDGHDFIGSAVDAGSEVVVCSKAKVSAARGKKLGAVVLGVEDTEKAYAAIAANYFQNPAEQLNIIGITGTNGKTTATYLLEHVLLAAGKTVGVVGTVNNRYTGRDGVQKILKTRFTTPEAFLLQEVLREMADHGVDQVIMEVSSHGLAQSRIGSLVFDVAAFTNLSRDHLDYHTDMEDYFRAKELLFSHYLKKDGVAVLPVAAGRSGDEKWIDMLHRTCADTCSRIVQWGESGEPDILLQEFSTELEQTDVAVRTASGEYRFSSPLVGRYNIDNMLTVYGICLAMEIDEKTVCNGLTSAAGAPGRVERVRTGPSWGSGGPVVLVDYAHTPDALEKMLTTIGALPRKRLFCVVGCGGDRDNGKRALMGEIAGNAADIVVVTDDNPRTEDPDQIVSQIEIGLRNTNSPLLAGNDENCLSTVVGKDRGYIVLRDRAKAIQAAIRVASPGDIVVIAGKGHEPYQLTLEGKRFFDDRLVAEKTLYSWTAELVAKAVNGRLYKGGQKTGLLGPVTTDSRVTGNGTIFVALKGENHDAHDFAQQAIKNGAACLVVERELTLPEELAVTQVVVSDTLMALGELATFRRRAIAERVDQKIIGLTGSCGKTTVKEMVAAILARTWPAGPDYPLGCVLKTKGNFNNLIGLPLSLLPLDIDHRAAVLEMGMNRPGELSRLGAIGDPDISCITNIHGAHLEGLQSIEGVARAKEELFQATKESGVLIVNLDDPRVRQLSSKYRQRKITFSVDKEMTQAELETPDIWTSSIHMTEGGVITFNLHHGQQSTEIHLYTVGEHNVSNALCSAAIAIAAGASLEHVSAGLADFRPPDKRMELLKSKSGFTIINDTYNANPASMTAGLKTLKKISQKTSVAIIGDMRELGETSRRAHYNTGKVLADLDINYAGVVGDFKQDVVQGALDHGMPKDCLKLLEEKADASRWIENMITRGSLEPGDVVLVKASRGLTFETIVAELVDM